MQERIRRLIEEARKRAPEKKPYIIEPTGRGRVKCHADVPDPKCPRCQHRVRVRRIRELAFRRAQLANMAARKTD